MANLKTQIEILAEDKTKDAFNSAEKNANKLKSTLDGIKNSLLGFFGVAIGGALIKDLIETADKWLALNSQIKNATKSTDEFNTAQEAILNISRKTYTSLEANAGLFSKINLAISAMGGTMKESIGAVDQIAKLVALSGTSAESAAAGIFQFTQAIAANRFSGQEYNSVAEQTPALLKAIYQGLNVNIGTLRKLAEEGVLDAATILGAIRRSTAETDKAFAALPITMSKALQNVSNSWLEFIGKLNESKGATKALAIEVNFLADNMQLLGTLLLEFAAATLFASVGKLISGIIGLTAAMRANAIETRAAAVANAELAFQEKERIAALKAAIAVEQQEIRAKIATTQATIAAAQAELRYLQTLSIADAVLLGRVELTARLTAANASLASSTALLAEQERALAASRAAGVIGWKNLISFTTLFSAAIAGLISFEFGNWARESFAWVEKLSIRVEEMIAKVAYFADPENFTINPIKIFKDIDAIEDEYQDLYDTASDLSIKERKQREENAKKAAEEEKKALEEVNAATKEGFAKRQKALEQFADISKERYEREIKELEKTEQKKLSVISASQSSQDKKQRKTIDVQLEINAKKLALTKKISDEQLAATKKLFDDEIAEMKKRNLSTDKLEKDSALAMKEVLKNTEKEYQKTINFLIGLEKDLRDKAAEYAKKSVDDKREALQKLRELETVGLNEKIQAEERIREIRRVSNDLDKALADKDFVLAAELSKKKVELLTKEAGYQTELINKKQAEQSRVDADLQQLIDKQAAIKSAFFDARDEGDRKKAEALSDEYSRLADEIKTAKDEKIKLNATADVARTDEDTASEQKKAQAVREATIAIEQQATITKQLEEQKLAEADKVKEETKKAEEELKQTVLQAEQLNTLLTAPKVLSLEVQEALDQIKKVEEAYKKAVTATASLTGVPAQTKNEGGFIESLRFAVGGNVPGSGSTDTVPAMLTPGEFVITKQAAARLGSPFLHSLNSGGVTGYAKGGSVGSSAGETVNVNLSMGNKTATLTGAKSNDLDYIIKGLKKAGRVA